MKIIQEPLSGVFVLQEEYFEDERGFLYVPFHAKEFGQIDHSFEVSQTMLSISYRNVLRGLHYQDNQNPVAKIINCIKGSIYDVIVDLREKSTTFGQWFGIELGKGVTPMQIYAPVGTAHGFVALSQEAHVVYHQSGLYDLKASCIMAWDDPDLAIKWPIENPILSSRDRTQGESWQEYKSNPIF